MNDLYTDQSDEQQEPQSKNAVSNTPYAFTSATLEKALIDLASNARKP